MLTLQLPTLLALLGTALMAVVIFAPERVAKRPTISYAPPFPPAPFERWCPPPDPFEEFAQHGGRVHDRFDGDQPAQDTPAWPALVDPRAAACDAAARLGLVDALATVRAPWARAILLHGLDDERDPAVRDALVAALGA